MYEVRRTVVMVMRKTGADRQGCLRWLGDEEAIGRRSETNKGRWRKKSAPGELKLPYIDGRRHELDVAMFVKEGREKSVGGNERRWLLVT